MPHPKQNRPEDRRLRGTQANPPEPGWHGTMICSVLIYTYVCIYEQDALTRLIVLLSVRSRGGVMDRGCSSHLVSVFPWYAACFSLNALSYLCYAGAVDSKKGERRIRLLSEARAVCDSVDCAGVKGARKLLG